MANRKKYRKRPDSFITAVQLDLDTEGFIYKKWGAEQKCKRGDWLVNNAGEIYTIDNDVFQNTYQETVPGQYIKTNKVWAEIAEESGFVKTIEGKSEYSEGDYLVSNNEDGTDAYCMSAEKFKTMYELDE